MEKTDQIILWHDNNIVLNIENCDFTLCVDNTNPTLPYRWLELETGQKFAELDGWHYRIKMDGHWSTGWETIFEENYFKEEDDV